MIETRRRGASRGNRRVSFDELNPKSEVEFLQWGKKTSRVESNGRLSPAPLLPLVEPDVQISRIRLSCKYFVIGVEVQGAGDIGSGSALSGGGIFFGFGD